MQLAGKIISFLGDSITQGWGVVNQENRYDNIIKREADLKETRNYGIGGTKISRQRHEIGPDMDDLSFCGRAFLIDPNSDIIIVYGGTNDYWHGAPLGESSDKTPETFFGAVDYLMSALKERYANAQIVFLTPCRREKGLEPSENEGKAEARTLKEYVEVIKAKGKEHNIPVLDLYEKLAIDPDCEQDKTAYTMDGLHLNDAGHEKLAECVLEFLKSLQ